MVDLQEEMENMNSKTYKYNEGVDYMSDANNWLCVHVTKYEPKKNSDGDLSIETTGMATGYKLPRATVHFTLNQIVHSHMGGNWDNTPIVVLVPYKDIVGKNGNPQEIALEDTYFTPNPETGLALPESSYIVKPNPDMTELFEIGSNGATYKTGGYTSKQIEEILQYFCSDDEKKEYENCTKGIVSDYDVPWILNKEKRLIKAYEMAKDKKAFLRGMLEEKKFEILNYCLRNAVVKMAMRKMGYHYVLAHEGEVSKKVAEVAISAGISGNSGDKGHSASVEHKLQQHGCMLNDLVDVLKTKDINIIYEYLTEKETPLSSDIIANILSDKPIPDVYKTYEEVYKDYATRFKKNYESEKSRGYFTDNDKNFWTIGLKKLDKESIKEYNPYLHSTLFLQARRVSVECKNALKELRQDAKAFASLKQLLENHKKKDDNIDDILKELYRVNKDNPLLKDNDFLSMFQSKNSTKNKE